jgi:ribosome recycling factor
MINDILEDSKERMQKSLDALAHQLSKLRTGRAHPDLLSGILVDYYDMETPLSQMANITVLDARTLGITPWEKGMSGEIEKAIMKSDLGLNPANLGDCLRVPLPVLTEETRKDMTKLVRASVEKGRVSVRSIRRDANSMLKELHKENEISEDELKRGEDLVQKLTDTFIARADKASEIKEKDLMEI